MRPLTFKGFLRSYLRDLSGSSSISLSKLIAQAEVDNPRLREPLFLYAFAAGKQEYFLHLTKEIPAFHDASQLAHNYSWEKLMSAFEEQVTSLPERYQKVYDSYRSKRDRFEHEDHTKTLMWKKIAKLKQQKGISNYRIYRSLGLNPGNANAFLTHGDTSKLSLATTRKTLSFLEAF